MAGMKSGHFHFGHHCLDPRDILGVVQLPELSSACLNLNTENGRVIFKKPQLLQAFQTLQRARCGLAAG